MKILLFILFLLPLNIYGQSQEGTVFFYNVALGEITSLGWSEMIQSLYYCITFYEILVFWSQVQALHHCTCGTGYLFNIPFVEKANAKVFLSGSKHITSPACTSSTCPPSFWIHPQPDHNQGLINGCICLIVLANGGCCTSRCLTQLNSESIHKAPLNQLYRPLSDGCESIRVI